ncbi:mechanosensitive ion channel domain-containing protein [Desulfoluna sp.]|uniref:mechanosensitive ion channel domain-containing protein n=1 Tax=Desulfoluna sp. TaxID=2045199 RepID=UPI00261A4AAF|nr:mechanosensitive ion channel domain-containing protein [Desulfoluna sp.]
MFLLPNFKIYLPLLISALISGLALWLCHWVLLGRHTDPGNERKIPRQLTMMGLTLLAIIVITLSLPITDTLRTQVFGLIGLIVSGMFAFSSTTVIANFMAGLMLRITGPFRVGDFIRVGDLFGRVTERGLFDTEIQAETRELIAIPNTVLITQPVTTIRSSGTIISITLSLGYDIHHMTIEPLLLKAATESGLEEPFVHILDLGNFSVTYRISGFLSEVKGLITAKSSLFKTVLDTLHAKNIEIMSPSFMAQRPMPVGHTTVPKPLRQKAPETETVAEEIVFDKAEQAESLETKKREKMERIAELEARLKKAPDEEKKRLNDLLEKTREQLKTLTEASGPTDESHQKTPNHNNRS